jgi:hypothetical protein
VTLVKIKIKEVEAKESSHGLTLCIYKAYSTGLVKENLEGSDYTDMGGGLRPVEWLTPACGRQGRQAKLVKRLTFRKNPFNMAKIQIFRLRFRLRG